MDTPPSESISVTGFRHEAMLYASPREFVDRTAAFVREGVERDEPVLVVVDGAKISALQVALDKTANRVRFADMADVGKNPARIIPAWQAFVDENSRPGQRLRGIGEPIWAGRTPSQLTECHQHEALLNLAFGDTDGFWLLCPYDTTSLDPSVIDRTHRTHPDIHGPDGHHHSTSYDGVHPHALLSEALPVPPDDAATVDVGPRLAPVRRFAAAFAIDAGYHDKSADTALVAGELAANSQRHGRGPATLRMWTQDDALICEVHDRGTFDDPMVGRVRPGSGQLDHRGLWLVNQLCDLVQIRSTTSGTTVRAHLSHL